MIAYSGTAHYIMDSLIHRICDAVAQIEWVLCLHSSLTSR